MKMAPRLLSVLAVVCLLTLFFFPLWEITLIAPQYPDGITMYIWINQITGDSPGTLQNINILNHYVGMKMIEPDSIPELVYFPWVVGGLAIFGLIAAAVNKPWFYFTFTITFVVLGALGIYDFYLWEYDYGHNLSETAPIKVPGQSYQPPLFGSKMLLNFNALSYPGTGGIFTGIAMLLSILAFWIRKRFNTTSASSKTKTKDYLKAQPVL
jgi:copper chaperone NosL